MRLPVKPLCEKKRARSDGTAIIFFQYCYSWDPDLKTFLNSEIAIPPEYWDKKKLCIKESLPTEFGDHEKLNDEIDRQLSLACELIKFAKRQGVAEMGSYVKEKFSPGLKLSKLAQEDFNLKTAYVPEIKKKKEGFFKQWEDYITAKKKRVKPATITAYNNTVGHFEAFEKYRNEKITFASFDYQFYEDFLDFLTYHYELPRKKKRFSV